MLWPFQESFYEHRSVPKSRFCLGSSSLKRVFQGCLLSYDSHTSSATSECCLNDDGKPVLVCEGFDIFEFLNRTLCSGHNGYIAFYGESAGRDFVSQGVNGFSGGSNEYQTCRLDSSCEPGVLREESVTRMDQIDPMLLGNLDDLVPCQVCAHRSELPSFSNHVCFVGLLSMHAETVLITEDSYRL